MEKNTSILLPEEFVKYLDKILSKKEFGFQSREEIVKAAIRDYFDKIIGKWYEYGLQKNDLVPRVQNKDKPIKTESKPIKRETNKAHNPPATQIQKPNLSSAGKLPITEKMKMEFKSQFGFMIVFGDLILKQFHFDNGRQKSKNTFLSIEQKQEVN